MNKKKRLKKAIDYISGIYFTYGTDWITPELLEQHKVLPVSEMGDEFINFVMNLKGSYLGIGKAVQRTEDVPYKTEIEVAAGYWELLRHEYGEETVLNHE